MKGMPVSKITLTAPANSHLLQVVKALLTAGWRIERVPEGARLLRNGQKIILRTEQGDLCFRLFVYKVTDSGRNRPDERRVEMTSKIGLVKVRSFPDVVLGISTDPSAFVGFNAERLTYGGETHNASSFFNIDGLKALRGDFIKIDKRSSKLFTSGVEYHAFFLSNRIAEYLCNRQSIHTGAYGHDGPYSGRGIRRARRVEMETSEENASGDVLVLVGPVAPEQSSRKSLDENLIEQAEKGELLRPQGGRRKITPEEFVKIKRAMEDNGELGEKVVLALERNRLRKSGRNDLADSVRWVSAESVGEGYDILSYETDGTERFIEVKTSIGNSKTFDLSDNEWRTACRLGDKYYICRVTHVRSSPKTVFYCDPRQLEESGEITKTANGWRVTLR
jgi:hypothetical protein